MERNPEKPFDALILDLTIPGGMGGKKAVKKLLEIDPELPVVCRVQKWRGPSRNPPLSYC